MRERFGGAVEEDVVIAIVERLQLGVEDALAHQDVLDAGLDGAELDVCGDGVDALDVVSRITSSGMTASSVRRSALVRSSMSGSNPKLVVRLAWASRSTQRTAASEIRKGSRQGEGCGRLPQRHPSGSRCRGDAGIRVRRVPPHAPPSQRHSAGPESGSAFPGIGLR